MILVTAARSMPIREATLTGVIALEVVVIVAGPVGLTLATELARHGVRPRLIDKAAAIR